MEYVAHRTLDAYDFWKTYPILIRLDQFALDRRQYMDRIADSPEFTACILRREQPEVTYTIIDEEKFALYVILARLQLEDDE